MMIMTVTNDNSDHPDCNDNLNILQIAKNAEKGDTTTTIAVLSEEEEQLKLLVV